MADLFEWGQGFSWFATRRLKFFGFPAVNLVDHRIFSIGRLLFVSHALWLIFVVRLFLLCSGDGVFIGLMIVVSIAFFIGGIALAVLAGGIFSATSNGGEPGVAAIFGAIIGIVCVYGIALLAFIGPIVYFGARWSVAGVGLVDQRWGAIESLQESWRLTRGHVWRCIILVTLLFIFYAVIYAALMAIAFGATALVLPSSTLAGTIIFALVSAFLPMLWQPIQSAAFVALYYDLRMRNQGYDLDLRIQQLETEVGRGRDAQ